MRRSAGQAVIFALLLTAVVITVGLAVVSQSIVDVKTSTQSQETVKAFTATEAGIEKSLAFALVAPDPTLTQTGSVGTAQYSARVVRLGYQQHHYTLPRNMVSGDAQTLWLVSHDPSTGNLSCSGGLLCATLSTTNSSFDVYFGRSPAAGPLPALALDIYYKTNPATSDYGDVEIARATFDPDSTRRTTKNNFGEALTAGPYVTSYGETYAYKARVDVGPGGLQVPTFNTENGLQMIRARILYSTADQPVSFDFADFAGETQRSLSSGDGLPSQGFKPESTGTIPNSSSIKLTSIYPWPDPFPMTDYAIITINGSLCKGGAPC